MPIYEFICPHCGHCFEKLVFTSDEGETFPCPLCGNRKTERLMSSFSCGRRSSTDGTGFATSNACAPQGGFS